MNAARTIVVSGATGSKYDSSLIHQISLSNLEGEYATILTTQEAIALLNPES